MSVIALTCQYELQVNGDKYVRSQPGEKKASQPSAQTGNSKSNVKGKGKAAAQESSKAAEAAKSAGGDDEVVEDAHC